MTQPDSIKWWRLLSLLTCLSIVITTLPVGQSAAAHVDQRAVMRMQFEAITVTGSQLQCGAGGFVSVTFSAPRELLVAANITDGDGFSLGAPIVGTTGTFSANYDATGQVNIELAGYETSDTELTTPVAIGYATLDCPSVDPPTETESATETLPPTETEVPTVTETATATETESPVATDAPTPTMPGMGVDPTTPTPMPTQPVIVASPPPDSGNGGEVRPTDAPVVQVPAPPVEEEYEAPAPTPVPVFFEVPDPSGGIWHTPVPTATPRHIREPGVAFGPFGPFMVYDTSPIPVAGPNSGPGSIVRIWAPMSFGETWVVMTVPDPAKGRLIVTAEQEIFYRILWDAIHPAGNILTVQHEVVETPEPKGPLIEVKEDSPDSKDRFTGGLFGSGMELEVWDVRIASTASMGTPKVIVGLLGPGYVFQLPQLQPGEYRMTIDGPYDEPIVVKLIVSDGPTASFAIQRDTNGEWAIVPAIVSVSQLPQTGSGHQFSTPFALLGLAAIGLGTLSFGIRLGGAPGRKR